jgi:hypothetical protein
MKIPKTIEGIQVIPTGESTTVKGETYQGMRPNDESIKRHWEYSVTTGRILDMTDMVYGGDDYEE